MSGRYLDPVAWRFHGDRPVAERHRARARALMGGWVERTKDMAQRPRWRYTDSDGTMYEFIDPGTGVPICHIYRGQYEEQEKERFTGRWAFATIPTSDEARNGWGYPYTQNNGLGYSYDAGEYYQLDADLNPTVSHVNNTVLFYPVYDTTSYSSYYVWRGELQVQRGRICPLLEDQHWSSADGTLFLQWGLGRGMYYGNEDDPPSDLYYHQYSYPVGHQVRNGSASEFGLWGIAGVAHALKSEPPHADLEALHEQYLYLDKQFGRLYVNGARLDGFGDVRAAAIFDHRYLIIYHDYGGARVSVMTLAAVRTALELGRVSASDWTDIASPLLGNAPGGAAGVFSQDGSTLLVYGYQDTDDVPRMRLHRFTEEDGNFYESTTPASAVQYKYYLSNHTINRYTIALDVVNDVFGGTHCTYPSARTTDHDLVAGVLHAQVVDYGFRDNTAYVYYAVQHEKNQLNVDSNWGEKTTVESPYWGDYEQMSGTASTLIDAERNVRIDVYEVPYDDLPDFESNLSAVAGRATIGALPYTRVVSGHVASTVDDLREQHNPTSDPYDGYSSETYSATRGHTREILLASDIATDIQLILKRTYTEEGQQSTHVQYLGETATGGTTNAWSTDFVYLLRIQGVDHTLATFPGEHSMTWAVSASYLRAGQNTALRPTYALFDAFLDGSVPYVTNQNGTNGYIFFSPDISVFYGHSGKITSGDGCPDYDTVNEEVSISYNVTWFDGGELDRWEQGAREPNYLEGDIPLPMTVVYTFSPNDPYAGVNVASHNEAQMAVSPDGRFVFVSFSTVDMHTSWNASGDTTAAGLEALGSNIEWHAYLVHIPDRGTPYVVSTFPNSVMPGVTDQTRFKMAPINVVWVQ